MTKGHIMTTTEIETTTQYVVDGIESADLPAEVFTDYIAARDAADALALEHGVEVEVVTQTGRVAHVATPVRDRNFHAFERVETPKFEAPHVEGYRPAYTRARIGAVVYRAVAPEDKDKTWLVLTVDDGVQRFARTTKAARLITNALRAERSGVEVEA